MYHYVRHIKTKSNIQYITYARSFKGCFIAKFMAIDHIPKQKHTYYTSYLRKYTKQVSVENRTDFLVKVSTFEKFPFPQFGVFKVRYLRKAGTIQILSGALSYVAQ